MGTVLLEDTGFQAVHGEEDCVVGGVVVHAGTVVAGTRESTVLACWMHIGLPEPLPQCSFEMTVLEHATVPETGPDGTVAGSGLQGAGLGEKPFVDGLRRHVGGLSGQGPAGQDIFGQSGAVADALVSLEKV